jgi:Cft2 family RNA processing exonuclease
MSDKTPAVPNERVVYLHGFDKKELFALVDLIKKNSSDPKAIAFSTSTKNNMKMTVEQLIQEVLKDHATMMAFNEAREAARKAGLPLPPMPRG